MAAEPSDPLQNFGIALEIICPVFALIVTILRVYTRLKIKSFGWDDTCIIVAMVLSIVMGVGSILCMKYLYIGIHYWEVPVGYDLKPGLIWTYVVGAVYNPILAIVKQSILIFLLRLASTKPGVRQVVWVTAIFNAALMVAVFLVVIFQCNPISMNWDLTAKGHCVNQAAFGISTACLTILTDIIALALPFYVFLDLKINKKTKIALLSVFGLGLIVTAVSIVRLYFLYQHMSDTSNPDLNYSLGFCVSAIEVNLAIITASGPALWPLVRSWMPRFFTSMGPSNGAYQMNADVEWTPNGQHRRTGAGNGSKLGTGIHSSRVVGGGVGGDSTRIGLKDVRGDRSWARMDIRSDLADSDEEVLTQHGPGILRTTDYSVTRDDDSRRLGSRGNDGSDIIGKRSSAGSSY